MSEVNKIKINDCEFGKGVFSEQNFFQKVFYKLGDNYYIMILKSHYQMKKA